MRLAFVTEYDGTNFSGFQKPSLSRVLQAFLAAEFFSGMDAVFRSGSPTNRVGPLQPPN